jgi:hypothetical protein
MAKYQTVRLRPSYRKADLSACTALIEMDDYQPADPAHSREALRSKRDHMRAAQEEELRLRAALAAARDAANAAEWALHNAILGARQEVIAQFGDDSTQVQALGLKRKSERARPGPRQRT